MPLQVAWLSLDERDNDPDRFWTYFVTALQTVQVDIGREALRALEASAMQSPLPPPPEAVLSTLINELAALSGRTVLVLDDYHLIQAQPIHDALAFLLAHLPPPPSGLHLVLATREDPLLPLLQELSVSIFHQVCTPRT